MNVDKAFKTMHKNRHLNKVKGDAGEKILVALAQQFTKNRSDCTIIHSYKYPYYVDEFGEVIKGNIKYEDGEYKLLQKDGYNDEIDLVIITAYRMFAIECKARTGRWDIFNHWAKQNSKMVDKSPICQAEKHARHLYASLHEVIPHGNPKYIIPITVFVDRCKVSDKRSKDFKSYVNVCNANTFIHKLKMLDNPLQYNLDTAEIIDYMMQIGEGDIYK